MDELELLKQDWSKEKNNEFRIYSEDELFQMTKKKSVSVAKWVFIIALCEILFWIGLDYILEGSSTQNNPEYELAKIFYETIDTIFMPLPYIFLGIVLYLNYKIRNTEEPKKLMKKILLMKKAIQWNIKLFLIEFIIGLLGSFVFSEVIAHKKYLSFSKEEIFELFFFTIFVIFITFIGTLFLRFIYHLIYGNLIYKLEKNYKELQEMETSQ